MKIYAKKSKCLQNHIHDSKAEAERCNELTRLQFIGAISDLQQQVTFPLLPSKKYPGQKKMERGVKYTCDFTYVKNGITYVEDVKSKWTCKDRDYILRRKMWQYLYARDDLQFIEVIR